MPRPLPIQDLDIRFYQILLDPLDKLPQITSPLSQTPLLDRFTCSYIINQTAIRLPLQKYALILRPRHLQLEDELSPCFSSDIILPIFALSLSAR